MSDLTFMNKFKPKERIIKEFNYWIVCIRGKQTTLGAAVLLLKRETESVANLLPKESEEFPEVVKWYEKICKEKFGAVKFNYIIMMMHDSFVHYHAFPRYDKNIDLFDITWEDKNTLTNFSQAEELSENVLTTIKDYMKN